MSKNEKRALFRKRQLEKHVNDDLLNLSFEILEETKQSLLNEKIDYKYGETGITMNVDKSFNPKRTVFSYIKFNKKSFILETLYSGKRSPNAKYKIKKNHVVNQFKIRSQKEYTPEVKAFIKDAFYNIKDNAYDFINKPNE